MLTSNARVVGGAKGVYQTQSLPAVIWADEAHDRRRLSESFRAFRNARRTGVIFLICERDEVEGFLEKLPPLPGLVDVFVPHAQDESTSAFGQVVPWMMGAMATAARLHMGYACVWLKDRPNDDLAALLRGVADNGIRWMLGPSKDIEDRLFLPGFPRGHETIMSDQRGMLKRAGRRLEQMAVLSGK